MAVKEEKISDEVGRSKLTNRVCHRPGFEEPSTSVQARDIFYEFTYKSTGNVLVCNSLKGSVR